LIPLADYCYICKVLVGLGTPYLGPDSARRTASHRHMPHRRRRRDAWASL